MTPREVVVAMLEALNASGINYIVTGSFATNLYAVPRSTQDVDFVVDAEPEELKNLFAALPKDIKAIVDAQGDNIDWPYVEGWCDRHGTRDLLEQLREEARPPSGP